LTEKQRRGMIPSHQTETESSLKGKGVNRFDRLLRKDGKNDIRKPPGCPVQEVSKSGRSSPQTVAGKKYFWPQRRGSLGNEKSDGTGYTSIKNCRGPHRKKRSRPYGKVYFDVQEEGC